jgi:hypothetical protein
MKHCNLELELELEVELVSLRLLAGRTKDSNTLWQSNVVVVHRHRVWLLVLPSEPAGPQCCATAGPDGVDNLEIVATLVVVTLTVMSARHVPPIHPPTGITV